MTPKKYFKIGKMGSMRTKLHIDLTSSLGYVVYYDLTGLAFTTAWINAGYTFMRSMSNKEAHDNT